MGSSKTAKPIAPNTPRNCAPQARRALLRWYGKSKRDLPWRRTRDPYRIWVAEVILQQTQVSRGAEYYERFLRRFPDLPALARAKLDDVLHAWAGLGYYARARNLHAAARQVADRHGGFMPGTYEELRSLPGVGEYTANAILSMAFDQPVAAVDANAVRVVARLLAIRTEPQRAPARKAIDSFAQALVARGRAREINQAVMDLGATVCLPRNPQCEQCPVARHCQAFASSRQDEIPVRPRRRRPGLRAAGGEGDRGLYGKDRAEGAHDALQYQRSASAGPRVRLQAARRGEGPGRWGGVALGDVGERTARLWALHGCAAASGAVAAVDRSK